ncbi:MAG: GNAT family N-acetyltransferase [Gemmataceae bacterium]|nr:GNAT family N-acetyltransferase [Gemmata sp.]MDW8197337.1 GNAT family N-acetyltransferase [Gemmataceae bacterium]
MMHIRQAIATDWPRIWELFQLVAASGEVFTYDETTTEETARQLWFAPPTHCFVAEVEGTFAGTYYLRANQPGRGSHVANAGYMVAPAFRGQKLAEALCRHSLAEARLRGFTAMQFNCVVSTNTAAIRAWQKCGFAIIGRVPGAFRHRHHGLVDVLIMHRALTDDATASAATEQPAEAQHSVS